MAKSDHIEQNDDVFNTQMRDKFQTTFVALLRSGFQKLFKFTDSRGLIRKIRLNIIIVLAMVWTYGLQAFGADFVVKGKISYEIFTSAGLSQVKQNDEFTVSVKDCLWRIETLPKSFIKRGKSELAPDYRLASSDGTNFYQITSYNNSSQSRIGPGSVPFCLSDPKLIVLWYAFCSGCYFHNLNNDFTAGQ